MNAEFHSSKFTGPLCQFKTLWSQRGHHSPPTSVMAGAMWNTICVPWLRQASNSPHPRARMLSMDEAAVFSLRSGDSCNSLPSSGNESRQAIDQLVAGYVVLDRLILSHHNVTVLTGAAAWEGGIKLRPKPPDMMNACLYWPRMLDYIWPASKYAVPCLPETCPERRARALYKEEEARCTPNIMEMEQAQVVERLVYLHHPNLDSPGHTITQIMPQLSVALAALGHHASASVYLHTNQDVNTKYFQQWVQLAGAPGLQHRLFSWSSSPVRAATLALPSGGEIFESTPWALQLCRRTIWRNLRALGYAAPLSNFPTMLLVTRPNQSRALRNADRLQSAIERVLEERLGVRLSVSVFDEAKVPSEAYFHPTHPCPSLSHAPSLSHPTPSPSMLPSPSPSRPRPSQCPSPIVSYPHQPAGLPSPPANF